MLYDAPVSTSYKVLTHNSAGRKYAKNGYGQVGNTTLPTNQLSQTRVATSSIYQKGIPSSLKYAGGGSYPAGLRYYGGGSRGAAGSSGLKYYGAGSNGASGSKGLKGPFPVEAGYGRTYPNPRGLSSTYRPGMSAYFGAGSRGASGSAGLRDAYINDNPPPGTLKKFNLSGLSDDTPTDTDSGTTFGPAAPTVDSSGGFFSTIGNAFSAIFTGAASAAGSAGQIAASNAVSNAINPPQTTTQQITNAVKSVLPTTILGFTTDTVLLVGAGVGAYFLLKKK